MLKSESIAALAAALSKFQGDVENASKSSVNPHFKSKYADLAELLNTVRPVLSANGLAIIQMPSFDGGVASVETVLTHSSGEYVSNTCSAPVSKQDAQGVGSAITYLRRYSLAAFCGIAQEDDDANHAVGNKPKPLQPVQEAPKKQTLNDERFQSALDAVEAGKFSKQRLLSDYDLTPEQLERAKSC